MTAVSLDPMAMGLLLSCRPGFEKECAQEILARQSQRGIPGFVKVHEGYVRFVPVDPESAGHPDEGLDPGTLVFARQVIVLFAALSDLPTTDRLTPIIEQLRAMPTGFSAVFVETADTNEAKSLSVFLRKFSPPLRKAMADAGLLWPAKAPRLHLFFISGTSVLIGTSDAQKGSPWPMGIPRLRFPKGAPSRSTLKLDEAFGFFLKAPDEALLPGMQAVDLGASPGGWTYQLVRRHLRVVAIDNGPMDAALMDSGLVTHLRVDGFRYQPDQPVDWLVCDMVEKPSRIARLVGEWLARGGCRYAIFNLKLPMKKRYEACLEAQAILNSQLAGSPYHYRLRFRQLYHDRAEVTGFAERTGERARGRFSP